MQRLCSMMAVIGTLLLQQKCSSGRIEVKCHSTRALTKTVRRKGLFSGVLLLAGALHFVNTQARSEGLSAFGLVSAPARADEPSAFRFVSAPARADEPRAFDFASAPARADEPGAFDFASAQGPTDELAAPRLPSRTKEAGAPDYTKAQSWAALPDIQDAADIAPKDDPLPEAQSAAAVDVFYIHPTTFRGTKAWNQTISDQETNAWTDVSVIERQASAFNACCKVYAPRYRQAAMRAVLNPTRGLKAYAFAYEDVKRAFAYFIEHYNAGRPFMIVGHSQGAFHAIRLLEEVVDGTPLKDRMVVAYVIGIGIPRGTFGKALKDIGPCSKPDDTGCVVSWNTFGRNADPKAAAGSAAIAFNQARYVARFKTEAGKEALCINPLTFDADLPDAPPAANLGALPGAPIAGPLRAVKPGLIGASCRQGLLYADIPDDQDFVLTIFPGDVLHMHDVDFFYQNIRANALLRAQSFLRAYLAAGKMH